MELRCCDSSCNIYLALAALIDAGLRGMQQKMQLPHLDAVRVPAVREIAVLGHEHHADMSMSIILSARCHAPQLLPKLMHDEQRSSIWL